MKTSFNITCVVLTVIFGLWASYKFLNLKQPNNDDLIIFFPAFIFLFFTASFNLVWNLGKYDWAQWTTQMDPFTIILLLISGLFAILGWLASDQQRSKEMFGWMYTILTFLAGFEAKPTIEKINKRIGK